MVYTIIASLVGSVIGILISEYIIIKIKERR